MTRPIYTPKPALGWDDMPLWEKALVSMLGGIAVAIVLIAVAGAP